MNFHVGQKVVCMDADFSVLWHDSMSWSGHGYRPPQLPILDEIYAIRGIRHFGWGNGEVTLAIYLQEIMNPIGRFLNEMAEQPFWIGRFRPVIERKTDISIFTEMLTPNKTKVHA